MLGILVLFLLSERFYFKGVRWGHCGLVFGPHRLPQQNTDYCLSLRREGECAAIPLSPEKGVYVRILWIIESKWSCNVTFVCKALRVSYIYARSWSKVKIGDKDESIRIRAKVNLARIRLFTVKGPCNAPCDYVSVKHLHYFSFDHQSNNMGVQSHWLFIHTDLVQYIIAALGIPFHLLSFWCIKTINVISGWFIHHFIPV